MIARLKRRLRPLLAAIFHPFHEHTCACGTTFYCQTGLCADQLCPACEDRQFDRWAAEMRASGKVMW